MFVTRFADMVIGICMVGCWCCGSQATKERRLLPHIRNCIIVCSLQCVLSLGSIITAIVGFVESGSECVGSIVSIVFACLLAAEAAGELFIWCGAYGMRLNQHKAPIPPIVDRVVPEFLFEWARRSKM